MRPVVTAAQMRALDAETIQDLGVPGVVLMETAGRRVAEAVLEMMPSPPAPVLAVCGPGNNGGDGFVAARVLHCQGFDVDALLLGNLSEVSGDAKVHLDALVNCGGRMHTAKESALGALFDRAGILVDAIFGTGLDREIVGFRRSIIEQMNRCSATVVSVDLPSGLHADTGEVLGVAVQASRTVALACPKPGNVCSPGFVQNGRLSVGEIGIPQTLVIKTARMGVLEVSDILPGLPTSNDNTHKTEKGHVVAIAGSPGKRGAGRLTGMAALRSGAGLVTIVATTADEYVEAPLMVGSASSWLQLQDYLRSAHALLLGPGMDTGPGGKQLVQEALKAAPCPLVLDADALNHIGTDLELVQRAKVPVVLTPHPGEAARLLAMSSREIQKDRNAAVRTLCERTGATVVLKGARTVVCSVQKPNFVAIDTTGGPELATAGSGDVLAGIIASILAQGRDPFLAATTGVVWHSIAGHIAKETVGPGVIASDLVDALPKSLERLFDSVTTA